jgi:drug/metabolite transporter (DMT)-like permease
VTEPRDPPNLLPGLLLAAAGSMVFSGKAIIASLERLIMYLTPTLVLLLGWVVDRRPIRRAQLAGMAVSYSGVLLVFGREIGAFGPRVAWGTTLIFTSTVTYALYLVYSGKLVQRLGSVRLVGMATAVACLCCLAGTALVVAGIWVFTRGGRSAP